MLQELESQGYLQSSLFSAEVFDIQKSQDSCKIEYATAAFDNSSLTAEKVVLAIGSPPNKLSFVDQLEASRKSDSEANICFIKDMYEPTQNVNLDRIIQSFKNCDRDQQNQVLIIGSNASALETLYSLNNLPEAKDLIDKFIVISPNGEFPHPISKDSNKGEFVPESLLALSKSDNLTAKQILEAVKQDEERLKQFIMLRELMKSKKI